MAGRTVVRLEGFKELERALRELPKATGKNVLRKVAKGALEPMANMAKASAPVEYGDLRDSITVSSTRTARAKTKKARLVGSTFRSDPSTGIQMAMGPSAGKGVLNYATFVEFGTVDAGAFPYMRPAWDSGAHPALEYIKANLKIEIDKAAKRYAKKLAKRAA